MRLPRRLVNKVAYGWYGVGRERRGRFIKSWRTTAARNASPNLCAHSSAVRGHSRALRLYLARCEKCPVVTAFLALQVLSLDWEAIVEGMREAGESRDL